MNAVIAFFCFFLNPSLPVVVAAFDPPAVFPASTRQGAVPRWLVGVRKNTLLRCTHLFTYCSLVFYAALAEKAKKINPTQYSTVGWSNRAGTVLTPQHLDPGVYTADRPFLWNNIDVGCRCTVIELPANGNRPPNLFVHSPVALDGPMQKALSELGNVKWVVSPNYEHVKFAPQWSDAYRKDNDVQIVACPGLAERMPDVRWDFEIPHGYRPKGFKGGEATPTNGLDIWGPEIEMIHLNFEHNPFTRRPFFNEVIFYHGPSKTLLVTGKLPNSDVLLFVVDRPASG